MEKVPEMLTVAETAKRFGLSEYAVRLLLRQGRVRGLRVGRGKLLVNAGSVAQLLETATVNDTPSDEPHA